MGDYLVRLYTLLREGGRVVRVRLAERMNVSPPAITQALRRMVRDGLILVDENKNVQLTDEGRAIAESTIRRHYLLERLLVDELGYDWAGADDEADRLEHSLSPELEAHLYDRLGRPTTCPHGNPFPGSPDEAALLHARTLASTHSGEKVVMLRVTEEGEEDEELMHFLQERGLRPGSIIEVVSTDTEAAVLRLVDSPVPASISTRHAQLVRVSAPESRI
jgi:DtxR family Mn-dependent transcriptional regulator